MKYELKITHSAHDDIQSIYNYVKKDGDNIAKKQVDDIYNSLQNIGDFPSIGKKLAGFIDVDTDYLYIIIKSVYIAFYLVVENEVRVIRILSTKQDYIKMLELD